MVGFIIVDSTSENRILLAPGALLQLTPTDVGPFLPTLRSADVCLVSLEVPLLVAREGLEQARSAGVLTVLDPAPVSGITSEDLADVDVLIPNQVEAAVGAHFGRSEPADAGKLLSEHADLETAVTGGGRGDQLLVA